VLGPEIRHDANIRNDNAFVPKKEQRMTDFVDEPDYESNGIDAQRGAGEKGRAISMRTCPQFRSSTGLRRGRTNGRRPNSGEQKGVIAISSSIRPTGQERQPTNGDRRGPRGARDGVRDPEILADKRENWPPVDRCIANLNYGH
jgi:hypothetical protein